MVYEYSYKVNLLNCNIVQVHLGDDPPAYLYDQLRQTRLLNPVVPIFLILSDGILYDRDVIKELKIIVVRAGAIKASSNHKRFRLHNRIRRKELGGFWLHASERFFVIESFLKVCPLENVVHLENDVMLYAGLSDLEKSLENYCPGVGLTMDSEFRCIPGIVFVRTPEALMQMNEFIVRRTLRRAKNDMRALALFMREAPPAVSAALPVLPPSYREDYPLTSAVGETSTRLWYDDGYRHFKGIFDAAAIGQYLGGVDPRNDPGPTIGFVNETAVYDPRRLGLRWKEKDGLRLPYGKVGEEEFPIFNLHIHAKRLKEFSSLGGALTWSRP